MTWADHDIACGCKASMWHSLPSLSRHSGQWCHPKVLTVKRYCIRVLHNRPGIKEFFWFQKLNRIKSVKAKTRDFTTSWDWTGISRYETLLPHVCQWVERNYTSSYPWRSFAADSEGFFSSCLSVFCPEIWRDRETNRNSYMCCNQSLALCPASHAANSKLPVDATSSSFVQVHANW